MVVITGVFVVVIVDSLAVRVSGLAEFAVVDRSSEFRSI